MSRKPAELACPCCGGAYATCCAKVHAGAAPLTAEPLMRSRYSAYVLGLTDYLQTTWHASTRPATLEHDAAVQWLGLAIRGHTEHNDSATVEFVARYRIAGRGHRLHETSRFLREDGRWFYLDGEFPERKA